MLYSPKTAKLTINNSPSVGEPESHPLPIVPIAPDSSWDGIGIKRYSYFNEFTGLADAVRKDFMPIVANAMPAQRRPEASMISGLT